MLAAAQAFFVDHGDLQAGMGGLSAPGEYD